MRRPMVRLLLAATLATPLAGSANAALIPLGAAAPDFTKTDLTGTPRSLSDYITGDSATSKVVLLFLLGYD